VLKKTSFFLTLNANTTGECGPLRQKIDKKFPELTNWLPHSASAVDLELLLMSRQLFVNCQSNIISLQGKQVRNDTILTENCQN